ncbi:hypothetical protein ElyMa_006866600 [Elysia marginata]|uniref:Uncharacterized protein n=1 Tax=Elysia marginata TaxID=1093978 RepID=A0AAV4JCI2_9GAST|nr:hypothetical protein ElyMa_006866600 [Elysia marginata]
MGDWGRSSEDSMRLRPSTGASTNSMGAASGARVAAAGGRGGGGGAAAGGGMLVIKNMAAVPMDAAHGIGDCFYAKGRRMKLRVSNHPDLPMTNIDFEWFGQNSCRSRWAPRGGKSDLLRGDHCTRGEENSRKWIHDFGL